MTKRKKILDDQIADELEDAKTLIPDESTFEQDKREDEEEEAFLRHFGTLGRLARRDAAKDDEYEWTKEKMDAVKDHYMPKGPGMKLLCWIRGDGKGNLYDGATGKKITYEEAIELLKEADEKADEIFRESKDKKRSR